MKSIFKFLKIPLKILRIGLIVLVIYSLIVSLFLYFNTPKESRVKVDPVKVNREQIYTMINDSQLKATKEGREQITVYRTLQCSMLGEACTDNPDDGDKNFNDSAFGLMANAIVLPYANPPASGIYWAYSGLHNAGFVPKTFAAEGIGFAALKPLAELWAVFRNIAYLLLVLLLVTIGFLIMFRVKINPQTVITLENALPRIIVTLIFVTFSFAIAGFMIDLMYIVIGLGVSAFNNVGHIDSAAEQVSLLGKGNNLWDDVFANGKIWLTGFAIFDILPAQLIAVLRGILAVGGIILLRKAPFGIGTIYTGDVAKDIAETGGILKLVMEIVLTAITVPLLFMYAPILLSLFVFLTALLIFFRLFFLLFKSYIMIVLLTIFSPLILLFNAIPGQNMFFKWIRNLAGHLLAFPMTAILLLVSRAIIDLNVSAIDSANVGDLGGKFWSPPFLYSANPVALTTLLGLGIIFMIPDLIRAVREAIGIKPSPLKIGAGLFFGGASGTWGGATSMLGQFGSASLGIQALMGKERSLLSFIRGRKGGIKPSGGGGDDDAEVPTGRPI